MASVEHYRQVGGWPANAPLELPLANLGTGGHITVTFETVGENASDVGENYRITLTYAAIDPVNGSQYIEPAYSVIAYDYSLVDPTYTCPGPVAEFDYYPALPIVWLTTEFDPINNGPQDLIVNVWIVNGNT